MARTKGSLGHRKTAKPRPRTAKAPRRKAAAKKTAVPSAQVVKLRKMVEDLKKRLEREAKARGIDVKALKNMRQLRDRALEQISVLKKQGSELSRQLKQALSDADKREQARRQALAKIEELRGEVARRKDEIARKSQELARLARESAERAKTIVMSEPSAPPEPFPPEPPLEAPERETTSENPPESRDSHD